MRRTVFGKPVEAIVRAGHLKMSVIVALVWINRVSYHRSAIKRDASS